MTAKTTLRATFVAAASACLLLAGGAQAAELVNGAYYGGGNDYAPGNWTVNTGGPLELGLRGHVYQQPAQAPVGNVYVVPLNSVASLDWSFDNLSQIFPTILSASLTISNALGGSFSYDPLVTPDNAQNPNGWGGEQNSLRLNFAFLNGPGGINYSAAANSTYNVALSVTTVEYGTLSDSIVIQQGAGGVPEPSTWALLILGFGATGAMVRSRRQRLAL
jgi:hypothetical protein